ncbi:MAG TPA: cutinase family protein, partial [Propionibacteriaceae bacterium]
MNLLASTVTAVLVTGLLGVVSASPSSAAVGCTPIAIMAARGSGEKAVSSTEYGRGVRTNGWEGPTLARLLRGYTASPFFTSKLRAVPVIGVSESDGYRAVGVNPLFEGIGSRVKPSADAGVGAALGRINAFQRSQPATCPKTKWVLIGYSQGAMVTRGVTSAAPGRIGMVFNAGDPYQLPRQTQNIGTGSAGIGIFRYKFLSLADELDAYYVDAPEGSVSLCHAFDTVCDVSGDPLPHLNYFKSARERARSGDRLAREVDSLLTASTVDPGAPAKVANDVVFAIDTTASMSDLIGTAVANADAIGRSVVASAERGRVGLVEYRDHGDEFVARRVVPLTRDVDAFSAGLNTLTADGGGDTPEAVYSGIVTAAGSEWAGGASRSIVVIGDAPAHDPEDVTGYTSSQMAALLRGETPASALRQGKRAETPSRSVVAADGATSLYGLVADGELQSQLSTVTAGSGGTVYDIGVDGSAAELLTTVVDETALAPRANLRSSAAVAGFETTVSALDSVVPRGPGTFDFDLDDDGIFEVTGSEPTRGVVFNSPGNYLVSVRITDSDGRTSTATSTVAVSARAALEGGPVPGDPATAITGVSAPRRAYPGL